MITITARDWENSGKLLWSVKVSEKAALKLKALTISYSWNGLEVTEEKQ